MKILTLALKGKLSIRKCPVCGKYPQWNCWELIPNRRVELWALRCSGEGGHYRSTNYWTRKGQTVFQWNRMCDEEDENLLKGG